MIQIELTTGDAVTYCYSLTRHSEDLIRKFADGEMTAIVLMEDAPEIRRGLPAWLTIKRTGDGDRH